MAPAYFPKFRCKCGDCRTVCCSGWRITVSEAEYFRMLGLCCSDALRTKMDITLRVSDSPSPEEYAYIVPSQNGNCHLLDENGLCMLHAECGEAFQPAVCRLYPRSIKPGDITEAVCSGSCEKTVEILMDSPRPLPFITVEKETVSAIPPHPPADPVRTERRLRCLELWQNAQNLPAGFSALAKELGVAECVCFSSASEYLRYACTLTRVFSRVSISLSDIAEEAFAVLHLSLEEDTIPPHAAAAYAQQKETMTRLLPEAERYFFNLITNHMFFVQFPYAEADVDLSGAYDSLCAVYLLLRFLCVAGMRETNEKERFADIASAVFRYVEHTDFYRNAPKIMRRLHKK